MSIMHPENIFVEWVGAGGVGSLNTAAVYNVLTSTTQLTGRGGERGGQGGVSVESVVVSVTGCHG